MSPGAGPCETLRICDGETASPSEQFGACMRLWGNVSLWVCGNVRDGACDSARAAGRAHVTLRGPAWPDGDSVGGRCAAAAGRGTVAWRRAVLRGPRAWRVEARAVGRRCDGGEAAADGEETGREPSSAGSGRTFAPWHRGRAFLVCALCSPDTALPPERSLKEGRRPVMNC